MPSLKWLGKTEVPSGSAKTSGRSGDKAGNFLYYEGIVHDISERRKMENRTAPAAVNKPIGFWLTFCLTRSPNALNSAPAPLQESFDEVSVLFAGPGKISPPLLVIWTPRQLVKILNEIFSIFDQLAEFYQL